MKRWKEECKKARKERVAGEQMDRQTGGWMARRKIDELKGGWGDGWGLEEQMDRKMDACMVKGKTDQKNLNF